MDHLVLPHNPTIRTFDIPFLCSQEYDGGEFNTFPERAGWVVKWTAWPPDFECWFAHDGRKVDDDRELASFLQLWLFFGLLSQVLGKRVETTPFRYETNDGRVLLSTKSLAHSLVEPWVENVLAQDWAKDEEKLQKWCEGILSSCLGQAYPICYRILHARRECMNNELTARVCMGIAALARYLRQAMEDMFDNNDMIAPTALKKNNWRVGKANLGGPLFEKMEADGWCSNTLATFEGLSLVVLWYFANLEPPRSHDRHQLCTPKICNSLQVDESKYRTAHVESDCGCEYYGPPPTGLAQSVTSGTIPLVEVVARGDGQNSQKVQVVLHQEQRDVTEFVAISHVWADGYGNPHENRLPKCVLLQLQSWVNRLFGGDECNVYFWMDTICLPVSPPSLRRKAIETMDDTFKRASRVLVLDSYLRGLDSGSMSLTEMFARTQICDWTRRMWTYVEGNIGTDVYFQFQDQAVSLDERMKQFIAIAADDDDSDDDLTSLLSTAENAVFWDLHYRRSHTILRAEFREDPYMRIMYIERALKTRQTSQQSDEPLCIGVILDLDVSKIVNTDDVTERMQVVWSLLGQVPASIIFTPKMERLSEKGYRWATTSIKSLLLPPTLFDKCGEVSPDGLKVTLFAALFKPTTTAATVNGSDHRGRDEQMTRENFWTNCFSSKDIEFDMNLKLRDEDGLWYNCEVLDEGGGKWHHDETPVDFANEEPAILLCSKLVKGGGSTRSTSVSGLLITYPRADTNMVIDNDSNPAAVVHVKAHKLVYIKVVSAHDQRYWEQVRICSVEALARFDNLLTHMREDEDLWVARIAIWLQRRYQQEEEEEEEAAAAAADVDNGDDNDNGGDEESSSITILFQEYRRRKDRDADPESLSFYCAVDVAFFCRMGDWCHIALPETQSTWCVD